ncbi:MAG: T9SS type A sorting domain-containing protein [Gemmatimonadetes bacterium]|nr:T9SS type A sorting domain-containing protein [Gemmatimonadota bacterium]
MTRKLFTISLLALILAAPASAALIPDWGQAYGDEGTLDREAQAITAVDTDTLGNIYIAGNFTGQIDFGGPTLVSTTTNADDIFVAKFDASGNHIWSIAGGGDGFESISDIYAIPGGGVAVCGRTNSSIFTISGESDTTQGNYDALLMVFSVNGSHSFTRLFGGSQFDEANGVVWDPSALSVYVFGKFRTTVDFGVGAPRTSNGGWDLFLADVKVWGTPAAVWTGGGANEDFAGGLALDDAGDLGFAASFIGSTDLGNGTLTSTGTGAALVGKFTSVGTAPVWTQVLQSTGSTTTLSAEAITTDGASFYVTGVFNGSANFGLGNHTSNGDYDLWTGCYKSGGTPVWSRTGGSVDPDQPGGIDYHDGQVVITGSCEEAPTFDGVTLYHNNRFDALMVVYDETGDLEHARRGGGTWNDYGYDAVMTDDGPCFVGSFGENASWSGLVLNALDVEPDGFIVKYLEDVNVAVEGAETVAPSALSLGAPTPNPTRGGTALSYTVSGLRGIKSATVYDIRGRRVRALSTGSNAWNGRLAWDSRDDSGARVAPGVYFVRATDGASTTQRRVTVVR